jgi:hypothetical protein
MKVVGGLGFGSGAISFAARKDAVGAETLARVEALLASPEILVPVDTDADGKLLADDGCGDGRPAGVVTQDDTQFSRSLNRAKVFGGGATMAAAVAVGLGQAQGQTLSQVFAGAIQLMGQHGLDFGAHTDDHAQAPKSGCGAIDNAPAILQQAVAQEQAIRTTITALGIDDADLDDVYENFKAFVAQPTENYSGHDVMDSIAANHKVIKQLTGDHKEMYIVLNMVPTQTINQAKIREVSQDQVQVFGVDMWRVWEIAHALGAEKSGQAFLAELVYTLATAAVLTAGDLPVYAAQLSA